MSKEPINWGQEFLPIYPDGYTAENITPDGHCPCCGRRLMHIEDEAYCPSCYMNNRKKYGRTLSDDELELVMTLMTDQWLGRAKASAQKTEHKEEK